MPTIGAFDVSLQGYGAMGLSHGYGRADDAESIRTLHRAIELGINLIDTANIYGAGHKIMGEYRDTCRRVEGRWYFASRVFTIYRRGAG